MGASTELEHQKVMRMPGRGRASVSLRTILAAIVAMAAIPTLVFAGILLDRYAANQRERAEAELQHSAVGLARAVDAEFTGIRSVLLALASSPRLATGDLAAFEQQLRAVKVRTGRDLELVDLDGQILARTWPPAPSRARIETGNWKAALEERRTYVTNILQEPDGNLYARVVVPVA
ncbi:MAG TPA: hypothetical protein VFV80_04670, partial [Geminicoccaceae bacterium]|nr:hypothetical protein [Geminicoccaceae bacterium]